MKTVRIVIAIVGGMSALAGVFLFICGALQGNAVAMLAACVAILAGLNCIGPALK